MISYFVYHYEGSTFFLYVLFIPYLRFFVVMGDGHKISLWRKFQFEDSCVYLFIFYDKGIGIYVSFEDILLSEIYFCELKPKDHNRAIIEADNEIISIC